MSIRDLSVDFLFYGLLDLVQRSAGLLMLPIYTRVLSQQEYGDLDILLIMISIGTVLVDLQFLSGFARLYLQYRGEGQGPRFVGTVVLIRLAGGLAIAGAIIAAGRLGYLELSVVPRFSDNTTAWILVALMVPLSLTYDVFLQQARMLRWKKEFAVGALSSAILSCAATTFFGAVLHWGMRGVLLGLVVGKMTAVLVLAWTVRREMILGIERQILGPLLRYTLPLVPGWWLGFSSAYIGRFFIYGVQGADENAILAVSMKVASTIGLFAVSFRAAWQPLAMSYIGNSSGEVFYVRSIRLFMAGALFSALCLGAGLHVILAVVAPKAYAVVELYFPLFAVAMLIGECETNMQLGNQIARRTHWISASSLVYLVLNVLILATLTERLGIVAAGMGLVVASVGKWIVTYVTSQRSCHIPYDVRAMTLFGIGCALYLLLGAGLGFGTIPVWGVRSILLVLAFVLPWWVLDTGDRRLLAALATRWIPRRRDASVS